jgi:GT2 family glycosyltransferase
MIKETIGKKYPQVSIIIVNYNGRERLRRCLKSVFTTGYPNFRVVLVDNASTDGSTELIEKLFRSGHRLEIVKNRENLGHSEGHNVGAKAARGKYLVFLDDDSEIMAAEPYTLQDWLLRLVEVMESDESIGLAQAKIVLAENNRLLDNTGLALDALGTWQTTYGLKEEEFKEPFEILAASSGGCIIRRDVFDMLGGFDADYFIYDDDTDLSLRARLLGYKIVFVPSAVIAHHSKPAKWFNPFNLFHSAKNRICTMLKTYEMKNLWWRLITLNVLTLMVSLGFFAVNKPKQGEAVMKGAIYPIANFRKIWVRRLLTQSKRRVGDVKLISKGLITNGAASTMQDLKLKIKNF